MAMRNPNGYGSVYKLSGKRRKPWAVVKTISISTGKQERALLGTFETRAEANEFLVKYNRNPYDLKSEKLTFYEVFELFHKSQTSKVIEKTLINYEINIKFFKVLFDKNFQDITLLDLQSLFDNSDLSHTTLANKKGLATSIFSFAIKRNLIDKNIASNIEINKKKETIIERKIFTNEEINLLWNERNNPKLKEAVSMLLIMLYTSLRISELLSLENKNIYLEEDVPYIDVVKSKTLAGIRAIPIHDKILPVIKEYRDLSRKYLFEYKDNIFSYETWKYSHFKKTMEYFNWEHTPHDCRHTFITRLSMTNANPIAIRAIVGHTGKSLTENVYTHFPLEELKRAIDLLN